MCSDIAFILALQNYICFHLVGDFQDILKLVLKRLRGLPYARLFSFDFLRIEIVSSDKIGTLSELYPFGVN